MSKTYGSGSGPTTLVAKLTEKTGPSSFNLIFKNFYEESKKKVLLNKFKF
jgi:hypothetical protein